LQNAGGKGVPSHFRLLLGPYALCRMIGLDVTLLFSEKAWQKQRLREVASLSQISRLLRKSGKQKSGLIHFFDALIS
jgi:hypothetical protein